MVPCMQVENYHSLMTDEFSPSHSYITSFCSSFSCVFALCLSLFDPEPLQLNLSDLFLLFSSRPTLPSLSQSLTFSLSFSLCHHFYILPPHPQVHHSTLTNQTLCPSLCASIYCSLEVMSFNAKGLMNKHPVNSTGMRFDSVTVRLTHTETLAHRCTQMEPKCL